MGCSVVIDSDITSAELIASLSMVLPTSVTFFFPIEDHSSLMTADTDSILEQWLVVFMHI